MFLTALGYWGKSRSGMCYTCGDLASELYFIPALIHGPHIHNLLHGVPSLQREGAVGWEGKEDEMVCCKVCGSHHQSSSSVMST